MSRVGGRVRARARAARGSVPVHLEGPDGLVGTGVGREMRRHSTYYFIIPCYSIFYYSTTTLWLTTPLIILYIQMGAHRTTRSSRSSTFGFGVWNEVETAPCGGGGQTVVRRRGGDAMGVR